MNRLLALILTAVPLTLPAAEPLTDEARSRAEEKPLELDPIDVTAEGFSLQQEATLRLLRGALNRPKSQDQKDKDVWVCWVDEATGSHLNYLNCARNGDLWALERPFGLSGPTMPSGGYGTILRSSSPVNRYKLQQALAALEGDEEFDREFVSMVLAGKEPPRDIPDEEEKAAFARAYKAVERLNRRGASEQRQIMAIEKEGLTLARYNHIASLVETYDSIENDIAALLD